MAMSRKPNWPKLGTGYTAVATGAISTVALKGDGSLWHWGYDGVNYYYATPTQYGGSIDFVAVAMGYSHAVAVKLDGTLWAWGRNTYGQLGNGT